MSSDDNFGNVLYCCHTRFRSSHTTLHHDPTQKPQTDRRRLGDYAMRYSSPHRSEMGHGLPCRRRSGTDGLPCLPSDRQKNRHTQHGKVWRGKGSASRVLAALASSPATKALDPDPFPRHSLRHAVYAALLHFGFETANCDAADHPGDTQLSSNARTTWLWPSVLIKVKAEFRVFF